MRMHLYPCEFAFVCTQKRKHSFLRAYACVRLRACLRVDLIKTQNAFARKIFQHSNALWVQKLSGCTIYVGVTVHMYMYILYHKCIAPQALPISTAYLLRLLPSVQLNCLNHCVHRANGYEYVKYIFTYYLKMYIIIHMYIHVNLRTSLLSGMFYLVIMIFVCKSYHITKYRMKSTKVLNPQRNSNI